METRTKVVTAVGVLLLIGSVAAADALVREKPLTAQLTGMFGESSSSSEEQEPVRTLVLSAAEAQGLVTEEKSEPSILRQLLPNHTLPSFTILSDNDRAGSITWVEGSTQDTARTLQALKESLLQSFSASLTDLKDETYAPQGKQSYSILTFKDPSLSEERIIFLKNSDGLYEIHVTTGKEDRMLPLVELLNAQK